MDVSENLAVVVAQWAGPRQEAAQNLIVPSFLLAATAFILGVYDCWTLQSFSPVVILAAIFGCVTVWCAIAGVDAKRMDKDFQSWRQIIALVIFGWVFTMFFVVGYHSPLHDMGCIRCAGTVLAVMVAKNAKQAMMYLFLHFFLALGAHLPHYNEEMLFLICTDIFMTYAVWGKQNTIEALEQLMELSTDISQYSFDSVHETLQYLCDAVVVVDKNLEVKESAPDLEALLGRTVSTGRNFQELIHHEDLQSLTEILGDRFASMESGTPHRQEAVQTRLLDSYGRPVSVHVFIAAVAPQLGKNVRTSCFLLGISEQWLRRKKDSVSLKSSSSSTAAKRQTSRRTGSKGTGTPSEATKSATLDLGPSMRLRTPLSDPELEQAQRASKAWGQGGLESSEQPLGSG